jgi:hypothetical protein
MSIDSYPSPNFSTSSAVLGYAEVTASQAGIATEVDLTGLAVTVNVPAGRRIRITGYTLFSRTVGDGTVSLRIREGATQIHQTDEASYGTDAATAQVVAILAPTAGTHTYKLTMQRPTGSGTVAAVASSIYPAYILVEDIMGGTGGSGPIQLAYAQVTTSQTFGAGDNDVTGLSVTVSVPAGRRLRITGHGVVSVNQALEGFVGYIKEGAAYLGRWFQHVPPTNGGAVVADGSVIVSPTAGTHTYKLSVSRYVGSGTALLDNAVDYPAYIVVEDVTGTPAPSGASSVGVMYAPQGDFVGSGAEALSKSSAEAVRYTTTAVQTFTGRRYRIKGLLTGTSGGAYNHAILTIRRTSISGTILAQIYFARPTQGRNAMWIEAFDVPGVQGAQQWVLTHALDTSVCDLYAPSGIWVEDAGAV